jgi:hypothetical protein
MTKWSDQVRRQWWRGALAGVVALATCDRGQAEETEAGATTNVFAARALQHYEAAQARFEREPTSPEAAWRLGRAAFEWAEFATNHTQRAALAQQGIAACRQALGTDEALAPAHHYLALNLGQLARTKTIGALSLVRQMERHFKRSIELDPKFHFAAAERSLGLLYQDAPGWPASIGSQSKARLHLERAAALAPDYPENQLCLLEALVKWGEEAQARERARGLPALLARARQTFAGDDWADDWADWDARWARLRNRLAVPDASADSAAGAP